MAQKPDGKAAGVERVSFTRPAAERISRVVRTVEQGDRAAAALTFDRSGAGAGGGPTLLRLTTVTGQWATGSTVVVTFFGVTSTPNTAAAQNLYLPIDVAAGKSAECVIARAGGTWTLVSVNLTKLKSFSSGEVQLFGHNSSGFSEWYSVTTCSTSTAA